MCGNVVFSSSLVFDKSLPLREVEPVHHLSAMAVTPNSLEVVAFLLGKAQISHASGFQPAERLRSATTRAFARSLACPGSG
jgi:hypothetical protein